VASSLERKVHTSALLMAARSRSRQSLGAAAPLVVAAAAGLTLVALGTCRRAPPRGWVVVSSEDSGDVRVVDARTDEVVRTIAVGKRPRGVRLSPDGRSLFVATSGSPKPQGMNRATRGEEEGACETTMPTASK